MLTKFSEALSGKLGDQWSAVILTPAFAFWVGGLLILIRRYGWSVSSTWFARLPEAVQIGIGIGALIVVTTSAFLVATLDRDVIQLLEGYWPRAAGPILRRLVRRYSVKRDRLEEQFQKLALRMRETAATDHSDAQLRDSFTTVDAALRRLPTVREDLMPTHLGNVLRAAEQAPGEKYGLNAVICWPRLWMLLPQEAMTEIAAARQAMDSAARLWVWGVMFLIWTRWWWWAPVVTVLTIMFAARWLRQAAETYGDLVEAAFDVYRLQLYSALRWPLPESPSAERRQGRRLSQYLWRGSDSWDLLFTPQPSVRESESK